MATDNGMGVLVSDKYTLNRVERYIRDNRSGSIYLMSDDAISLLVNIHEFNRSPENIQCNDTFERVCRMLIMESIINA